MRLQATRASRTRSVLPHRLYMTATPIPRTLAFTVWGDLEVSEIKQLPAGRKPIITSWITHERSSEAYLRLRAHLEEGRQAFVVCPLVTASESSEARAAEDEAERLSDDELAGLRVACIHGQLPTRRRRDLMETFARGDIDVLVATTVIEVGVDVGNATIMIIQEADRFGLAQLHQLRGRVGRGEHQSYCLLVSRSKEELTEPATERLQAMVSTTDGFELAEVDLELRGQASCSERGKPGSLICGSRALEAIRSSSSKHARLRERLARPMICWPSRSPACSVMRIIAGERKGVRLHAPRGFAVRPTSDQVKEAMFNLVRDVADARVLDGYAGTGALGLEGTLAWRFPTSFSWSAIARPPGSRVGTSTRSLSPA